MARKKGTEVKQQSKQDIHSDSLLLPAALSLAKLQCLFYTNLGSLGGLIGGGCKNKVKKIRASV